MTGVRRTLAVVMMTATATTAAAQAEFRGGSSRQATDRVAEPRHTDTSQRHSDAQRQTEAPKAVTHRQPEPQRQPGPQRQAEPQRQHGTSGHWSDPGPAWRPVGPAWRDIDGPSTPQRPGKDAFRATPKTYAPRFNRPGYGGDRRGDDRRHGHKRHDDDVYPVYPYVPYGYFPYSVTEVVVTEPAPADEPYGFLRLRILPRTADVYIDGAWAGTVDDFGGSGERMLPAGPHRVEVVAPGYETLTFDVRVPANETVTFTRELDPVQLEPPPPVRAPAEIPHKPLYIVPRCYIGDRPPLLSDLPAGCTLDDVRMIP